MSSILHQTWDKERKTLKTIPVAGESVSHTSVVKTLLVLSKTACILGAGCDSGRLLRALEALGYRRLVGLEISFERLSEIAFHGPSSSRLGCSSEVPFASSAFDSVVSAAVIEHVVDPAHWLTELARVTRSEGIVSIMTDTYMWRWLKRLGLYRSIQPLDEAIWPCTLIRWAQKLRLELLGCGGFVNTPDQRGYFGKQLLSLLPLTGRLQRWPNRGAIPGVPADETEAILDSVRRFNGRNGVNLWSCFWSYECYYWFRKR